MTIYNMTIEDYDEVYALWLGSPGVGLNSIDDSRAGIARYLQRNPTTSFVAEEEGRLVGAILAGHDGRRGFLLHTVVAEGHRNKGIGTKLAQSAIAALEEQGIQKAAIVVFEDNDGANEFWETLGFAERTDLVYRDKQIIEPERMEAYKR